MQASVQPLIEPDISRLRPVIALAAVVVALLLQAWLPLVFGYASLVDLPLLITVYLALLRRNPLTGLWFGLAIGLVQDSLSHGPIGLYGMTKTLVGYIASSLTTVIDVSSLVTRVVLVGGFHLFHQGCFWIIERVLLARPAELVWPRTLLVALVNALVALLLYRLLDRFREST